MSLRSDLESDRKVRSSALLRHWCKLDHVAFLGVGVFLASSYWLGGRALVLAGLAWVLALFADLAED